MRLISSDGHIDVPYEQVTVAIAPEDIEGETHFFIKTFHNENYYVLGDYHQMHYAEYVIKDIAMSAKNGDKFYLFPTIELVRSKMINALFPLIDAEKTLLELMYHNPQVIQVIDSYINADDFSEELHDVASGLLWGNLDAFTDALEEKNTPMNVFEKNEFIRSQLTIMLKNRTYTEEQWLEKQDDAFKVKQLKTQGFFSAEELFE